MFAWSRGGAGPRRLLAKTNDTVVNLIALPNGDVIGGRRRRTFTAGTHSTSRWAKTAQIADFRGQANLLTVSADGVRVGFGYEPLARAQPGLTWQHALWP